MKKITFFIMLTLFFFDWNCKAVAVESPDDSTLKKIISEAVLKGEKNITIPQGTYRISEPFALKKIKSLSINAQGVTLLMTKPASVLTITQCDNVAIYGLTVDYDPIPFTQGSITSISCDNKTLEFTIHQGYPKLVNNKGEDTYAQYNGFPRHFFDKKNRLWKKDANLFSRCKLDVIGGIKGKATFDIPQLGIEVGDYIAFDRRHIDRVPAVIIQGSTGQVLFEDFTVYGAYGSAFIGRWCEAQTVFRRVKISRGSRPAGASEDRLLSSNSDAINFAYCRKGPLIENSDISFMGDDGLNVHGRFVVILKVKSPTELLLLHPSKDESFTNIVKEGDKVRFFEGESFTRLGESVLKSISIEDEKGDVAKEEIAKAMSGYDGLNKRSLNEKYVIYNLKLATPVRFAQAGQWIDIPEINCPDFIVKNNRFHDHRARSLRLMGNNGLVEGNIFERTGAAAIQIGPELPYWREAGWVNNITIKNNQLLDIGYGGEFKTPYCYALGAISVCARTDKGTPPYPIENENITIENNMIDSCPVSAVYAYGAKKLILRKNKVKRVAGDLPLTQSNKYGLNPKKAFDHEWCRDVSEEENTVE